MTLRVWIVTALSLLPIAFAVAQAPVDAGRPPTLDPEPVSIDTLNAPLEQDPAVATSGEPDHSNDLKTVMESALTAAKKNDTEALRKIAADLKLPDSEKWFVTNFGEAKGKSLQVDYKHRVFEERLPRFFRQMVADRSTEVLVTCVDHAEDKDGTYGQRSAMKTMGTPVKLYSVRFVHPGETKGFHVFSFAYVDGGMRCVGRLGVFSEE